MGRSGGVAGEARGDHPHHLATHQRLFAFDHPHLLGDGHFPTQFHQASDVAFRRMVRHTTHGDGVGVVAISGRQNQLQRTRRPDGIFKKKLVEVTHPEKQQGIRLLGLQLTVLKKDRRIRTHPGLRILQPQNTSWPSKAGALEKRASSSHFSMAATRSPSSGSGEQTA